MTGNTRMDARSELVDFVVHRVFYPVLMLQRTGPHKARIEHMQDATRAEIERFRTCGSIEEVIVNYKRYLGSESARNIHSDLKLLSLPASSDLHEGFEKKVRELGFEPDTFLTSLDRLFNAGVLAMDQERLSHRAQPARTKCCSGAGTCGCDAP